MYLDYYFVYKMTKHIKAPHHKRGGLCFKKKGLGLIGFCLCTFFFEGRVKIYLFYWINYLKKNQQDDFHYHLP